LGRVFGALAFLASLALLARHAIAPARAVADDTSIRRPLRYDTFQPPAAGRFYLDPVFGTRVSRLSDAMHQADASEPGDVTTIIDEYATVDPFNMGATRLLLLQRSYFALYSPEGRFLQNLPLEVDGTSQPRWSRSDPNVLYYLHANTIRQLDVSTSEIKDVHVFAEYAQIDGRGESDVSEDGDHMVLIGDQSQIFVYQISTDTKGPVLDISALGPIDQIQITADNDVLVGWLAIGTARANGLELFDPNMRFLRQIAPAEGHHDISRDDNGDPIVVLVDAEDRTHGCPNGIVKIRLSDASRTCLAMFDISLAVHVSTPERGGSVVVSTFAPSDPSPTSGWAVYTNEILLVRMDGSGITRLAHHRSRPFNDYNWEPRASVSHDGRRIVFSSNFDLQSIDGFPAEYSDVYEIDLRGRPGGAAFEEGPRILRRAKPGEFPTSGGSGTP
jgi:hypothetical protein